MSSWGDVLGNSCTSVGQAHRSESLIGGAGTPTANGLSGLNLVTSELGRVEEAWVVAEFVAH